MTNTAKPKKISPDFIRIDARGSLTELLNGVKFENMSTGFMKKGAVMGEHYHKETVVYFFLISGQAQARFRNVKSGSNGRMKLGENKGITIPAFYFHEIKFTQDARFIMVKSIKYDEKNPDTYSK